jgi:hypothetical protein
VDSRRRFERRQVIWLFVSYGVLAVMTVLVMLYGAVLAGWRRPKFPWE